jgi:hypothetical protein
MDRYRCVTFICLFLVIPITAIYAHNNDDEIPINTAQELVAWCQNEVEQVYLARDQVPRNWRVRHHRKGNYIIVRLKFRIKYEDKVATCQIRKGAQRRYAIFQDNVEQ